MRVTRSLLAAAAAIAMAVTAVATGHAGAASHGGPSHISKAPTWAPFDTATITPGMQTYTGNSQCTANFIFHNGTDVFLGQAAHCAGTGGNTAIDGCSSPSQPLGAEVTDVGGNRIGEIAYSSWVTMQSLGEQDPDACAYNDFALIKLDSSLISHANPSMPTFGGPTGLRDNPFAQNSQVWGYANSQLRLGVLLLPRRGIVLSEQSGSWSHKTYTVTPGIPGDSGSGLLDTRGRAAGVLSTIELRPFVGSNNYSDLLHVLDYAAAHGMRVSLVPGDVPFHHDITSTLL